MLLKQVHNLIIYKKGEVSFLKLSFNGLLTVGGEGCTIKSVKFVTLDSKHRLKVYNGDKLIFS